MNYGSRLQLDAADCTGCTPFQLAHNKYLAKKTAMENLRRVIGENNRVVRSGGAEDDGGHGHSHGGGGGHGHSHGGGHGHSHGGGGLMSLCVRPFSFWPLHRHAAYRRVVCVCGICCVCRALRWAAAWRAPVARVA